MIVRLAPYAYVRKVVKEHLEAFPMESYDDSVYRLVTRTSAPVIVVVSFIKEFQPDNPNTENHTQELFKFYGYTGVEE